MKALVRYVTLTALVAAFVLFWQLHLLAHLAHFLEALEEHPTYLDVDAWRFLEVPLSEDTSSNHVASCSVSRCFNLSRCLSQRDFRVYVYPSSNDSTVSLVYSNILKVLRESVYYTDDPQLACVFVLSIDTVDRDRRSENYVRNVNEVIAALPADVWNEGRNHVIFNLYHGTFPDYADHDLGFNVGYAMIARASANARVYRAGFDLSFPLFHKEHPLRTALEPIWSLKLKDEYLVSFKGKRYVYGIGSETRDSLYHLHNGRSVVMVTTCKHNNDWKKYEDERCEEDNVEYERWDYERTMSNSTFCLTPRGRRLGSFRFLESLRLGCIPVVLSDDWVLPFSDVIDWSQAAVLAHEDTVLIISDILSTIPLGRILHMKQQARALYQRYFSSVEKIVLTSMKIFEGRIAKQRGEALENWNEMRGVVPAGSPISSFRYSVVIQASAKISGRLNRVIQMLNTVDLVCQLIILWPKSRGIVPTAADVSSNTRVLVFAVPFADQSGIQKFAREGLGKVDGDFVVFLDERVPASRDDLLFLLECARLEPTRLIGYYSAFHKKTLKGWSIETSPSSYYSLILLHFAALSRTYLTKFWSWVPQPALQSGSAVPQCFCVLLNFMVSEFSGQSPILLSNKLHEPWMQSKNYSACLSKLVPSVWPLGVNLISSQTRLDPLLFLDNVGSYRKRFAGMEAS